MHNADLIPAFAGMMVEEDSARRIAELADYRCMLRSCLLSVPYLRYVPNADGLLVA